MNPVMFAMFAMLATRQGRERQALAQTLPLAIVPGSPAARVAFGMFVARNAADEQKRINSEIADALEQAAPVNQQNIPKPRLTEAQIGAMPRIHAALAELPQGRRIRIVR